MIRLLLWGLAVTAAQAQAPQDIVVTSGSSFQIGIPHRGSIGTIFCTGLNVSGTAQAEGVPLPWSLAGVTVTIDTAIAPLFSVSGFSGYQQINFQVPQEAVLALPTSVTVTQNGKKGMAMTVPQDYLSPGNFFTLPDSPYGAFQRASDYSLITAANPAHPGETLIGYLTGLVGTVPVVPTGQPSPYAPLAVVPQQTVPSSRGYVMEYAIVFSEGRAPITFLGLAPGLVGVYQVNFALPPYAPSGDLKTQLQLHTCNDACIFGGQSWGFSKSVLLPVR